MGDYFFHSIQIKNSDTPITLIIAPTTSLAVIFCLKKKCDGHRIKIGVSAINVEAMPAFVYCTAINETDTPIKGPKIVAPRAAFIPFTSRIATGIV